MALLVIRLVESQTVVVRGGFDLDLVVKSTAAGVIKLVQDIPSVVPAVLAVGGVRSNLLDEASFDGPPLEVVRSVIVDAAEAEGLLGAVLERQAG